MITGKYKHNFIKLELQDGSWRTYLPQNNLKQKIQELNPKNIYISVNKFLRYKEHNLTYKYQNIPLQKYGLIDIDAQSFSNPEEAEEYLLKILKFLKDDNIQIEEINQTNIYGGYQIIISPNSYFQFQELLEQNKILNIPLSSGILNKIDWWVYDEKRVRRACPSWNGNRNCYAYPLFLRDCSLKTTPNVFLGNPESKSKGLNISNNKYLNAIYEECSLSPLFYIPSNALGMPLEKERFESIEPVLAGKPTETQIPTLLKKANDNGRVKKPTPEQNKGQVKAIKSPLPAHFLVKQISNSVYGCSDLYAPVLKYSRKPSKRIIKALQAYSIGNLYMFQNHNGYALISPKSCQRRRLEKIYTKAKCWQSLQELQKFKQNWLCISHIYDIYNKEVVKTLKFINIYEQEAKGNFSYPHLLFLNKFIKKDYNNVIGIKPKVYIAEIRKRENV